jgi:hypothetical protein
MFTTASRTLSFNSRCSWHCTKRLYTAVAASSSLPPRDWRTSGHPAPRSLIDREDPIDLSEDIQNQPIRPIHSRQPSKRHTPREFAAHNASIKKAFPDGWSPPRKLSREAMDGLRHLHSFDPETFTTPVLADKFRISPEGVRRILKSKWEPTREQRARYAERERRQREQFITQSRLEEMKRQMEIKQERRDQYEERWERQQGGMTPHRPDYPRSGRTKGIDSRDRLTFE